MISIKGITFAASVALLATSLSACLDGDSGGKGKKAKFVDSAVVGINYKTSSGKEGVTGEGGQFSYKKGDSVTFYIGAIELPAVVPNGEYVTPAHIAGVVDWQNDTTTINIARFLQSLDDDGDLTNGIQIPEAAAAQATASVNFADTNAFESAVADYMAALNKALVNDAAAIAHLNATINELGIVISITGVDAGGTGGASKCTTPGQWALAVETSGIVTVEIPVCYPDVPTQEDMTANDGTLTGITLVEGESSDTKKVYTATSTQGGFAVQVKYIFTLNS